MSKYLDFVRTLPCSHCKHPGPSDPHHLIGVDKMGKMGGKNHDITAMPLCNSCHREVHRDSSDYAQVRWMVETQVRAIEAGVLCFD